MSCTAGSVCKLLNVQIRPRENACKWEQAVDQSVIIAIILIPILLHIKHREMQISLSGSKSKHIITHTTCHRKTDKSGTHGIHPTRVAISCSADINLNQ